MKRRLRVALALGAAFVALWFAVDFVREWRDRAWIEARIEAMRALGEPTTLAELAPPPMPDEENVFTALEPIAVQMRAEENDESQRFPRPLEEGWSPEQLAQIDERTAAHPERSPTISSALRRPRYRAPWFDDIVPILPRRSLDDPAWQRDDQRARSRIYTPLGIANWLRFEVLAETMREEPKAALYRALGDLVELALKPPILHERDVLVRLSLHAIANRGLCDALAHPRASADVIEPLWLRLSSHPPKVDSVLLLRMHRVELLERESRGRSTEVRAAIEKLDELERQMRAGAKPAIAGELFERLFHGIDETIAQDRFLGVALAARRFEASEGRWPQSLQELEARMPAGGSVPEGVVLEAIERGLRLVTPLPPKQIDAPYELLLRRAR